MQRGLDAVSSLSRQLLVPGGPRSLLADGNAPSSHFRLFSVPQARRVALALGGSRNDLLVAATAAGLGKYHEKLGVPCQELRLAMPATQHREHEPGGNWFSLARVDVPTSDAHPGPYFGVVAERLAAARREPALQLTGAVAAALHRLPGRVLVPGVGAQIGSVDFVATTIPGYRRGRHLGGGEVEGVYPFGPRLGRLANVVGAGNEDRLDVGVALDPFAVEDPDLLVQCIVSAFDDLTRAAGLAPAPVRSSEGSPAA